MQKVLSLLLVVIPIIYAQIPGIGKCPSNVQVQENFDLNAYLGKWYEYARYPFIFEAGGKCVTARYNLLTNGTITVYNANVNYITETKSNITGTAEVVAPAKLKVQFPSAPNFLGGSNYWVLGTDYTNYAVVYSCSDIFFVNAKVVWILTRQRLPTEEVIAKARKVLDDNNVSKLFLIKTIQDECEN